MNCSPSTTVAGSFDFNTTALHTILKEEVPPLDHGNRARSDGMIQHLHVQSLETAEWYGWGDGCKGWHLLKRDEVSVIQEGVPAGKAEVSHFHKYSRQFFFVLEGEATMEAEGGRVVFTKERGVEIPPGVVHQFRNDSSSDVVFLVISTPKSQDDRYDTAIRRQHP